jgi:hypothetical protein
MPPNNRVNLTAGDVRLKLVEMFLPPAAGYAER